MSRRRWMNLTRFAKCSRSSAKSTSYTFHLPRHRVHTHHGVWAVKRTSHEERSLAASHVASEPRWVLHEHSTTRWHATDVHERGAHAFACVQACQRCLVRVWARLVGQRS